MISSTPSITRYSALAGVARRVLAVAYAPPLLGFLFLPSHRVCLRLTAACIASTAAKVLQSDLPPTTLHWLARQCREVVNVDGEADASSGMHQTDLRCDVLRLQALLAESERIALVAARKC